VAKPGKRMSVVGYSRTRDLRGAGEATPVERKAAERKCGGVGGAGCRKVLKCVRRLGRGGSPVHEGRITKDTGVCAGTLSVVLLALAEAGLIEVLDGNCYRPA
jgi:hypothetical protein